MRGKDAPVLLFTGLLLVAFAGCFQSKLYCDCAAGSAQVLSPVPVVQLVTSGTPCEANQPVCWSPLDGGACDSFEVSFLAAGTCHIVATAADGRQSTFDETVVAASADGCCPVFQGHTLQITLSFPPADAGAD